MLRFTIGDKIESVDWFDPLDPDFRDYAMRDLARELNRRTVVAFIGSGVSAAYGLPSWKRLTDDAVQEVIKIIDSTPEEIRSDNTKNNLDVLKLLHEKTKNTADFEPEDLLTLLEIASEILAALQKQSDAYHDIDTVSIKDSIAVKIRENNQAYQDLTDSNNPLYCIVEILKIKRFLTTNYDDLITAYFRQKKSEYRISLFTELGKQRPVEPTSSDGTLSSRPRPVFYRRHLDYNHCGELTLFADQVPPVRYGVYHLHGVIDQISEKTDSEDIISTERQYQELYLRDSLGAQLFRESLDLVYATNTILFIGVGMSEEDLNRILRVSIANMPHRYDREIFLVEQTPAGESEKLRNALR